MATVTSMRKVVLRKTPSSWFLIPEDLDTKFFELSEKYYNSATKENQQAFLKAFIDYKVDDPAKLDRLYVKDEGLYDKRRDHL